jgi:hypothetical protein
MVKTFMRRYFCMRVHSYPVRIPVWNFHSTREELR